MKKILRLFNFKENTERNEGEHDFSNRSEEYLKTFTWFHGNTTSKRAEALLVKYGEFGSFLVRESDQNRKHLGEIDHNSSTTGENDQHRKKYTLSFRDKRSVKHFRIKEEDEKFFFETSSSNKRFISIPFLINFYQNRRDMELMLLKPCIIDNGLERFEIANYRVKKELQIGKGNSSVVYKGTWNGMPVALKEHSSNDILSGTEIDLLSKLDNPGIVGFYGYCNAPTASLYLVLELMKTNLKKYLHQRNEALSVTKQIDFALNITKGMAYLEQKRIIHRDLAARNILINDKDELKISDFGLAISLADDKEYVTDNKVKITFKWAAPEVLSDSKFSIKSDVWSFGVTLYEICTKASEPYGDMDPKHLPMEFEKNPNFRLSKPTGCEDKMYKIMEYCWRENPLERLTFDGLNVEFKEYNGPNFSSSDT